MTDSRKEFQSGFTLFETLAVIAIIAIISAIAIPSWLSRIEKSRVATANETVSLQLRLAQMQAQTESRSWQLPIRDSLSGGVEVSVHPKRNSFESLTWEPISAHSVQIDAETTFARRGEIYYVEFDENGDVAYRLGRVTLSSRSAPTVKECVFVSTLIGAMRKGKYHSEPRDGKFCY